MPKLLMMLILQLVLAGVELVTKLLHRKMDEQERRRREEAGEPTETLGDYILDQTKRLKETTRSFRKKPDAAPPADNP